MACTFAHTHPRAQTYTRIFVLLLGRHGLFTAKQYFCWRVSLRTETRTGKHVVWTDMQTDKLNGAFHSKYRQTTTHTRPHTLTQTQGHTGYLAAACVQPVYQPHAHVKVTVYTDRQRCGLAPSSKRSVPLAWDGTVHLYSRTSGQGLDFFHQVIKYQRGPSSFRPASRSAAFLRGFT